MTVCLFRYCVYHNHFIASLCLADMGHCYVEQCCNGVCCFASSLGAVIEGLAKSICESEYLHLIMAYCSYCYPAVIGAPPNSIIFSDKSVKAAVSQPYYVSLLCSCFALSTSLGNWLC